jgi:hypothetical protein
MRCRAGGDEGEGSGGASDAVFTKDLLAALRPPPLPLPLSLSLSLHVAAPSLSPSSPLSA